MDINYILPQIEHYLNKESYEFMFDFTIGMSSIEKFQVNTIKRLIKTFNLYTNNQTYREDFLISLRNFLIVFNTSISLSDSSLCENNDVGIAFDDIDNKYFATLSVPSYIDGSIVDAAFIKKSAKISMNVNNQLLTNPLVHSVTGYTHYKSMDQKLAVQGALNTPDGYTTLVSLPTGGGKSLITQTVSYQRPGLTIVVVPTVSLAIDQKRVAIERIQSSNIEEEIFSYSSGDDITPINNAIKNKTAKILFISPEALLENKKFKDMIKDINKSRYLKNLIIDEAHIVIDWGDSFRVDYQCLEAWRNTLIISNPSIRTFLLSATFEERSVSLLKSFFTTNEKWIEIRCDALRHEPRFEIITTKSISEKESSIVELVKKLPHPMIVYVARPVDADKIKNLLHEHGINNVRTFTGLTKSKQREQLINEWAANEFDTMVATSAFGVGVDKGDVRSVIHTYIPQNANTYYQELGRGGRDRLPCLSIMCLSPNDEKMGKDRIVKKVLTTEKIVKRWDSLYNNENSKRLLKNQVYIDTSIKPNYSADEDIEDAPINETDMNWNIYVLLFLRRYSLIKIEDINIEDGVYKILIIINDDRLREINGTLIDHIESLREKEWSYYNNSYKIITDSIHKKNTRCISEMFSYTYPKVYEYCSGCNAHRKPIITDTSAFPLKKRVSFPLMSISEIKKVINADMKESLILYKNSPSLKVLKRILKMQISTIIIPNNLETDGIFDGSSSNHLLVVTFDDAYKLINTKNNYYISGTIAVLYSQNEVSANKEYTMIGRYLLNNDYIKVIHLFEDNMYIDSAKKNINELVNGPCLNYQTIEE